MKGRRIILWVATVVVTIGSNLAFNVRNKFRTRRVYGKTNINFSRCLLCHSLWTNTHIPASGTVSKCHTAAHALGLTLVATRTNINQIRTAAWHTQLTAGGIHCTIWKQVTSVTITK